MADFSDSLEKIVPGTVHLHFHGVPAEDVAAVFADVNGGSRPRRW
jgi:hypothetical protein